MRRLHCKSFTSPMATSDLPLVLVIHKPGIIKLHNQQEIINSYSNKLTIVSKENVTDLAEDQYPKVQGVVLIGLPMQINGTFMDSFPKLRVISTVSAGVDKIDVEEARKRGIKIGFTPVVGDCVADFAFALLLASARNVVQYDIITKQSNFSKIDHFWFGAEVSGSTIGIVGLGSIGSAVARRAKGFNMKILYHTRTRKDNVEKETGAEYCHQLHDLLRQADFVVLCVPLTPETKYLISAPELSIMKPSATLINVARGDIVNQDDLVRALQIGTIRGAALDVTSPEPLPKDHPLLTLPNVIITPHKATTTLQTWTRMLRVGMDNVTAGIYGKPLLYQY